MKKNVAEIAAQAIHDAGVTVVTHVPGFGGNEVFAACSALAPRPYPISFHEETAYTIAHGASLVGQRAATLIKSHGLAKAGNSVVDSLASGIIGGFAVLVFDDQIGSHSDSILDTEALVQGLGIPYQKVDPENIYQDIFALFRKSEQEQLPGLLLFNSEDMNRPASIGAVQTAGAAIGYSRDIGQHLLCPMLSAYQNRVLSAKRLGQDWRRIERPAIPPVPETLPAPYQADARAYEKFFSVFQPLRAGLVTGDTGISSLFAFPPYHSVDMSTCMGGSIPLAVGAYLGGYREVWALIGDFAFIAAGHMGLLEALQRQIPLKVVIFYNGKAAATGGQPIPENMLETILQGYARYVRYIHAPQDLDQIASVLNEAQSSPELRIVVADYRP